MTAVATAQQWIDRTEQNCISHWLPKLQETGVKTPRTIIVDLGEDLTLWAWGEKVDNLDTYVDRVSEACAQIGYPCFLRSGQTSGKHDWKQSCYLTEDADLFNHMYAIVEYCALADLSVSLFAARELIPTTPICTAFYGDMPITREFRFFVNNGEITHWQPYWPKVALDGQVEITNMDKTTRDSSWIQRLEAMSHLDPIEYERLVTDTVKVGKHFGGYWSVDWLQSTSGDWYCIDMALGDMSYKYDPETGEEG